MRARSGGPWSAAAHLARVLQLLVPVAFAAGCGLPSRVRERMRPPTPYERYVRALRVAGLDQAALGRDWLAVGEGALRQPVVVSLPFRETVYVPADEAWAGGYRMSLRRGERLTIDVANEGTIAVLFFADLFRAPSASTAHSDSSQVFQLSAWERVAGGEMSATPSFDFDADRDGDFVLRVQPELLRGVRFTLTIRTGPSLAFPVAGRDGRAIQSYFGMQREGGRRLHQGVDIFAPRGTPALAAVDGLVTQAGTNALGGLVVWLWDPRRDQSLYYAHLDSRKARSGARVRVGDTLGFIGNTGNARSTPTHLHFGIYRQGEGAVDPLPFLRVPPEQPAPVAVDTRSLGAWARTTPAATRLLAAPFQSATAAALAVLPRATVLRLTGAAGRWYRVLLPDGTSGYVAARSIEPADRPLRRQRAPAGAAIRERPRETAVMIDSVSAGARLAVLGHFGGFLLVQAPSGRPGWLAAD